MDERKFGKKSRATDNGAGGGEEEDDADVSYPEFILYSNIRNDIKLLFCSRI